MYKLSGEQCKALYLPDDMNIVLLGPAGSGKSLIALYKAVFFLMCHSEQRCCLVCYNSPIVNKMKADFEVILSNLTLTEEEKKSIRTRILINTHYSLMKDNLNTINKKNNYFLTNSIPLELVSITNRAFDDIISKLIKIANEKFGDSRLFSRSLVFFRNEISWIQGMGIDTVDKYENIERLGRGRIDPVNRGTERRIIYFIFEEYKKIRKEEYNRNFDFNDISWLLLENEKYIDEDNKFDFIIIDEFQDMDKSKIRSLTSLMKLNGNILLLGDFAQQILGTSISFKQLGINNVSKFKLSKNYRNTKQISELANSIIEGGLIEENEDEKINRLISTRQGPIPNIIKTKKSNYSELISKFFKEKKGSNGIIYMNLENASIIKGIVDRLPNKIEVYGINRVKGLEFDNLLIIDIDEVENLSEYDNVEENENGEIAKKLYVAITRAKTNLLLAYTEYDMAYYLKKENMVEVDG